MDPKITLPSDDWTLKSEAKSYIEEHDGIPRSDFACMHPEISLLSDDSILKSTATSKRMEVVVNELAIIDMDEDLNDIINKISKIVFNEVPDVDMDEDLKNLVNTMRKCTLAMSSCAAKNDSMLSEGYKSEIKKIIKGYSIKDVPGEQDAQSSRMTRIDEEDALNRRINFKKFVNHSDHLSSTCTSPMKKAVIDEITDVEKDATLIDSVNKKRKEGTMAGSNGAGRLDSKDSDRSTKKARYDPWPYILSVKSSEKYNCELRRRIEKNVTKVGKYSLKDVMFDPYDARNSPMVRIYDGDVVTRYENFKKFDIVLDHSDHLFSGRTPVSQRHTDWAKMIHEDWRTLEENLPDTIFVRAYEPRKDLLRAVIIGAEGTPYHDGLFFFDLHFPTAYPLGPPVVRYHSGGLGINPNLYTSGEVCLSLPTIQHKREELWVPNTSTLLQLLVSIQDQYFTTDPIYCALGFVTFRGNVDNSHYSVLYNESTFIASLKTMVYIMNKPPKELKLKLFTILTLEGPNVKNFESFVVGHFRNRARGILMACKAYIEGVQVGRVVSGEGNENGTRMFRYEVTTCIKPLIAAFSKIGATEAEEFLHLSEMKKQLRASAPNSRYKSEIKKIIKGYSIKDVPGEQDAQSSRMTRIDEEDALNRRINFKKFVNHSDHLSSTCTSPMKKAVIDEITDVEKDATLIDSVNKKRKEGTMAGSNGAGRLDSKDSDRSTKKARYDPWPYILSVKSSEKYNCELRRRIEKNVTKVGKYSLKDVMFDPYDARNSPMVRIYDGDVVTRYENFKKFDIVLDHSDHLFSGRTPVSQRYTEWAKMIHEDWRTLEENLPDKIYVRTYEPRKDLLRAVIIGAEGTPYHDGLFFFDLHFPTAYPLVPPVVRYHSGGLGINPNLYTSGEVCLSLPTIQHKREELWVPNTSTLLQLLVSIQDQYFTTDPIYCALGFVTFRGNADNSHYSVLYNESTFIASLKTMVYIMNKPPKNFEAFVVGHFRNRVRGILMACKAYIEGVQVGRVVSGEGNENGTRMFRYEVTKCIKPLVAAFIKIGATEAEEFLYLSEIKKQLPASASTLRSITTKATES